MAETGEVVECGEQEEAGCKYKLRNTRKEGEAETGGPKKRGPKPRLRSAGMSRYRRYLTSPHSSLTTPLLCCAERRRTPGSGSGRERSTPASTSCGSGSLIPAPAAASARNSGKLTSFTSPSTISGE